VTWPRRIGLIVPSSNVTMETELPAILRRHPQLEPGGVTFHSSRARLGAVTALALRAMNVEADRCAREVADARVDAVAYACLVALTSQGPGFPHRAEQRLRDVLVAHGCEAQVVSSAGALARHLQRAGHERVALIAPYVPPLTETVVEFLAAHDIEVVDALSRSVVDNHAVGRLDPADLPALARTLDVRRAQAIIASACVQMPSLPALEAIGEAVGLPAVSAATATASELAEALGIDGGARAGAPTRSRPRTSSPGTPGSPRARPPGRTRTA